MAKKLFLNRETGVSRENPDSEVASSSSINSPVSVRSKQLPFRILDETSKSFPKFKTTGRSMLIKFTSPDEGHEPTVYLKECITALSNYLVDKVPDRDLVGLRIRNTEQGGWH